MPPASRPRRLSSSTFEWPGTLMLSSAPPAGESPRRAPYATADHAARTERRGSMSGEKDRIHRGYTRKEVVRGALGAGAAFAAAPLIAGCGGGSSSSSSGGGSGAGSPKRGGDLRVGMLGGSSSDTLDAGRIITEPDTIR